MNLATAQRMPTALISWDSFRMNEREIFEIIDENSTCCLPFRRSEKKIPSNYMLYSLLSRYPMPSSSYLKTCILLSLSLSLTLESRTLVELRMELLSSSVALLLLNDIIVGDIDEQEENWVSLRAILEKFILFSRTLNFHLMLTTTPKTRTMTKQIFFFWEELMCMPFSQSIRQLLLRQHHRPSSFSHYFNKHF